MTEVANDAVRQAVIRSDRQDFYNKYAKFAIVPVLLLYIVHAIAMPGSHTHNVTKSSDGGLTMAWKPGGVPTWLLALHSRSALALVVLVILQKELLVRSMRASMHQWIGYAILVACILMDGAGYAMGRFSAFPNFDLFSVLFALPFAAWIIAIPLTARWRWLRAHRFASNMLVKGCIVRHRDRARASSLPIPAFSSLHLEAHAGRASSNPTGHCHSTRPRHSPDSAVLLSSISVGQLRPATTRAYLVSPV
jgi:hypothetical protein